MQFRGAHFIHFMYVIPQKMGKKDSEGASEQKLAT